MEATASSGRGVKTTGTEHTQDEIIENSQDMREMSETSTTGVLLKNDVTAVVQAVFNGPVVAGKGE